MPVCVCYILLRWIYISSHHRINSFRLVLFMRTTVNQNKLCKRKHFRSETIEEEYRDQGEKGNTK
jgi:hypothetical protein